MPEAPKPPEVKPDEIIVAVTDRAFVLAALAIGIVVGVGVYFLLTHVMIEDADNA